MIYYTQWILCIKENTVYTESKAFLKFIKVYILKISRYTIELKYPLRNMKTEVVESKLKKIFQKNSNKE